MIRGALRAENPDLLTVVLPQSLSSQPQESQELLKEVQNVIEMSENDDMSLMDASRCCNRDIIARVDQVVCILFHDSNLLLETCREAKESSKNRHPLLLGLVRLVMDEDGSMTSACNHRERINKPITICR